MSVPRAAAPPETTAAPAPAIPPAIIEAVVAQLVARHGAAHEEPVRRGVTQAAARWWAEDGDAEAFAAFCGEGYLADEPERARALERLESQFEGIQGRLHEIRRELREPLDLDRGPIGLGDMLLADVDLANHLVDDLFRSRVAFFALLNFPVHGLAERLRDGGAWSRETWARSRMMDQFAQRIPAAALQEVTRAFNRAEVYVADYKIRLDRVETASGERLFPEGLRLTAHWGLRDELKARYVEGAAGLPRQRLIQRVMERIIRQEIPEAVRDNADLVWRPDTNEVRRAAEGSPAPDAAAREPDTRYGHILANFRALRGLDRHTPDTPTAIHRRFELDRQVPEEEAERLLMEIVTSPEAGRLARLVRARLGRPLEPFDIWYSGFKPRGASSEEDLDAEVRRRYPEAAAFQADLPGLLGRLGFAPERARWLAERIVIDASRSAGHAMPALRRSDSVHLRTRVEPGGMRYKGFNVALHELGHNVEQVFSLHGIDRWFLAGVPNTGCTEAFAFTFQGRDLEVLGQPAAGGEAWDQRVLDLLWSTYESAAISLVDMRMWRWMYAHPAATAAELREAVRDIARDIWNRHFAPHFDVADSDLLAVYSHIVMEAIYLPDYTLGYLIAFQIARHLRRGDFAAEVERIARQGCLTPDAWMRGAVGEPVSTEPLLAEARRVLDAHGAA
jgi:hypothetical protein